MGESKYLCNLSEGTLEYYYEEPADYDDTTYQTKQIKLDGLADCRFSYSDGKTWNANWSIEEQGLPQMVKLNFRFRDEEAEGEFVVNIPVSP